MTKYICNGANIQPSPDHEAAGGVAQVVEADPGEPWRRRIKMLKDKPKGWFSYDFDVFDRTGERVGHVDLSNWNENAKPEVGETRYEATHRSGRKEFVLSRDGVGAVGSLRPGSAFKREWTAELPEELPPEVRIFVMWLVVLLWRRADSAALPRPAVRNTLRIPRVGPTHNEGDTWLWHRGGKRQGPHHI